MTATELADLLLQQRGPQRPQTATVNEDGTVTVTFITGRTVTLTITA